MRAPSMSMKRPRGGSFFSTCCAVQAVNRARPAITKPRSATTTPAIEAIIVSLPARRQFRRHGENGVDELASLRLLFLGQTARVASVLRDRGGDPSRMHDSDADRVGQARAAASEKLRTANGSTSQLNE